MTVENFLRSACGGYLYFNRVDNYKDFPDADAYDGRQLPLDTESNKEVKFIKTPDFSVGDYYDMCRGRTYACCFSLENSCYIWTKYANGGTKGKVCVVFDFDKLRARLNAVIASTSSRLEYEGTTYKQIFDINYGVVEYVEWDGHRANVPHLPNPIKYTFLKAKKYAEEKELRVSLSASGMVQYAVDGESNLEFRPCLTAPLDFTQAIADGTIREVQPSADCDPPFFMAALEKLKIRANPPSC